MYTFFKMQGLGNDFVIFLDHPDFKNEDFDYSGFSKAVAERRLGIGCDQIIFLETKNKEIPSIRFFNADGSEAEACGNGTRCAAKLYMQKNKTDIVTFDSLGGKLECQLVASNMVSVTFKKPIVKGDVPLIPEDLYLKSGVFVDVGNPHLVILDPMEDFLTFGPELENHPHFPNRTNVGFATVKDSKTIHLRVWERGSGLTLACGSGACAAAVAAFSKGLCLNSILVSQPGGDLNIDIHEDKITQTGPAHLTFEGTLKDSFSS